LSKLGFTAATLLALCPRIRCHPSTIDEIKRQTTAMAHGLKVVGLMNVQFAIQHKDGVDVIYVLRG
jgi:hypothetical protein